jgi:hypothetical protein
MRRFAAISIPALILAWSGLPAAEPEKTAPAREALKPFNMLVGKWNAAGIPEGPPDKRQDGHWTEVLDWSWKFKGDDAWIIVTFDKSKNFKSGELRALPKENAFRLKLETLDGRTLIFDGEFNKDRYLTLQRVDDKTKQTERLVFALLHSNRITYQAEVKPDGKTFFTKLYRVGATKDGEPLVVTGFNEKECVVSGGQGTSAVTFKGKTYYVCCSGCRDAFNEDPAKYVAEFEKKRAAANKK